MLGGASVTEELVPGFRFSSCGSRAPPPVAEDHPRPRARAARPRRVSHERRPGRDLARPRARPVPRARPAARRRRRRSPPATRRASSRSDCACGGSRRCTNPHCCVRRWRSARCGRGSPSGDPGMFEELVTGSIGDLVANYLDSPELQGFTAFPGIVSVHAGPDSPGTAYVFAHHAVGGLDGELGAHGFVRGGMGGVTQALAVSARAAGGDDPQRTPGCLGAARRHARGRRRARRRLDHQRGRGRLERGSAPDDARSRRARASRGARRRAAARARHERLDGARPPRTRRAPALRGAPARGFGPGRRAPGFSLLGAGLDGYRRAHAAQLRGELRTVPSSSRRCRPPRTRRSPRRECTRRRSACSSSRGSSRPAAGTMRERFADLVVGAGVPVRAERARRDRRSRDRDAARSRADVRAERRQHLPRRDARAAAVRAPPARRLGQLPHADPAVLLCGAGTHPGGAVSGGPGHDAARAILDDWPPPLADDEWLARASAFHAIGPATRRGLCLTHGADRPWSQGAHRGRPAPLRGHSFTGSRRSRASSGTKVTRAG